MVSGGFNFTIIKSFIPIFFEEANVLSNILRTKCAESKSNDCDISNPVSMATMEMIGKTALGVKFNAQNGGCHRFVENLQTAMLVSINLNDTQVRIINSMVQLIVVLITYQSICFRRGNIESHIRGT